MSEIQKLEMLPGCMMPDGAEPCAAYGEAHAALRHCTSLIQAQGDLISGSERAQRGLLETIRGLVAEIGGLRRELADRDSRLKARARAADMPQGYAPPAAVAAYRAAYAEAFEPGTENPNAKALVAGIRAAILADREVAP